jgi:uncharacterized protein YlaI
MIDYSGWCESCDRFTTIVIDTTKNNTSYENVLKMFLCEECEQKQVIEKRDKKLNQLLKRNWFDIFKR